MRNFVLTLCFLVPFLSSPAMANDQAIQDTITSQLKAFERDDFERAFEFAAPNIKQIFRNSHNFGQMVQQGYPMVWRPADVQFLPLRKDYGHIFQDVIVTDQAGQAFTLEYMMVEMPGGWRIAGVRILEKQGLSA